MCKSKSEGGLRCAAHTRPAYQRALKIATMVSGNTSADALLTAAEAYAATPAGYKAIESDIANFESNGNRILAITLEKARDLGLEEYKSNKEATKAIEQETLRANILAWARSEVPTDPSATEAYREMLKKDLDLDDAELDFLIETQRIASAEEPTPLEVGELDKARFITGPSGQWVGTPTDPTSLRMVADLERLASTKRREKRQRLEHIDSSDRRWVRYENDSLSEVLRAVQYDKESKTLNVTLRGRTEDELPEYTYNDVSPSLFNTMISARSMGRFYAFVFAKMPQNGSMRGMTPKDFSFAVHAANNMHPIGRATGPVPVKLPKRLAA